VVDVLKMERLMVVMAGVGIQKRKGNKKRVNGQMNEPLVDRLAVDSQTLSSLVRIAL